jgi:hypothetical protein
MYIKQILSVKHRTKEQISMIQKSGETTIGSVGSVSPQIFSKSLKNPISEQKKSDQFMSKEMK